MVANSANRARAEGSGTEQGLNRWWFVSGQAFAEHTSWLQKGCCFLIPAFDWAFVAKRLVWGRNTLANTWETRRWDSIISKVPCLAVDHNGRSQGQRRHTPSVSVLNLLLNNSNKDFAPIADSVPTQNISKWLGISLHVAIFRATLHCAVCWRDKIRFKISQCQEQKPVHIVWGWIIMTGTVTFPFTRLIWPTFVLL